MLTDGGQHFVKHLALEALRRRKLATDDQPIQVAFRDEVHLNELVSVLRVWYLAFR